MKHQSNQLHKLLNTYDEKATKSNQLHKLLNKYDATTLRMLMMQLRLPVMPEQVFRVKKTTVGLATKKELVAVLVTHLENVDTQGTPISKYMYLLGMCSASLYTMLHIMKSGQSAYSNVSVQAYKFAIQHELEELQFDLQHKSNTRKRVNERELQKTREEREAITMEAPKHIAIIQYDSFNWNSESLPIALALHLVGVMWSYVESQFCRVLSDWMGVFLNDLWNYRRIQEINNTHKGLQLEEASILEDAKRDVARIKEATRVAEEAQSLLEQAPEYAQFKKNSKRVGFGVLALVMVGIMHRVAQAVLTQKDAAVYAQQVVSPGAPTDTFKQYTGVYDGCLESVDDTLHRVFADASSSHNTLMLNLLHTAGSRRVLRLENLFRRDGTPRMNRNEIAHSIAQPVNGVSRAKDMVHKLKRYMGLTRATRKGASSYTKKGTRTGTQKGTRKKMRR
jgi:hypothetical protein